MESFWKCFFALFMIGLVNNFSYALITVGSQAIADHFNRSNLMPLFQIMLVLFSIPMLAINFTYLSKVNTLLRISVSSGAMLLCFVIMSICLSTDSEWGFPLSLIATLIMGMAQCIGECVNLGFAKAFPPEYVVGFTSGTGFAGIAASGGWIICQAIGISNSNIFLIFMPLLAVYWFCFYWIYKKAESLKNINTYSMIEKGYVDEESYNSGLKGIDEKENKKNDQIGVTGNALFTMALIKSVWNNIWFWGMNLGIVYFLEYCVITGFSDRATLKNKNSKSFLKENSYVIILFCYQFGVWCSRSSLKLFKVKKVWIVTTLQLINWVVWWLEAEFLFLNVWGEFVLTVWVGCMGGLAYVNTGYLILNSEIIPKEHKEASMNMSLSINSLGILAAALFCLVLDNFIITN